MFQTKAYVCLWPLMISQMIDILGLSAIIASVIASFVHANWQTPEMVNKLAIIPTYFEHKESRFSYLVVLAACFGKSQTCFHNSISDLNASLFAAWTFFSLYIYALLHEEGSRDLSIIFENEIFESRDCWYCIKQLFKLIMCKSKNVYVCSVNM